MRWGSKSAVIVDFVPSAPSFPIPWTVSSAWFSLSYGHCLSLIYLLEHISGSFGGLEHYIISFGPTYDLFSGIPWFHFHELCAGWITELRVPHASGFPALYLLGVSVALTQSLQIPCPTKEEKCKCTSCPAFTFLFSFWFILTVFDLGLLQRWRYLFFCPSSSKKHIALKIFLFPLQNLFVSVFFLFGSAGNRIQGLALVYTRQML